MALLIGDNFSYNGKKPNFERDSFETLAALKSFAEANIDNGHIAYCVETNKHYIFNSSNSDDTSTGKWRILESEFSNKVDISDLNGYLTKDEAQSTYQPIGEYALKTELPDTSNLLSKSEASDTYQLKGDYLTEVPAEYVTESELDAKGYLTTIPDEYVIDSELQEAIANLPIASTEKLGVIKVGSGLAINSETGILSVTGSGGTADSIDWQNVLSKPQINGHELASGNNTLDSLGIQPTGDYALKSEIPSLSGYATQDWVQEQGYLTSIPSEYITEEELNSKGYLTSVPDNYVTDNELIEAINDVKYTLPIASTDTLGGIKIGAGLSITGDGILSATGGSEITDVLDNKSYARTQGSWVDLTDWLTWGEFD